MACDLCGKTKDDLIPLMTKYQTKNLKMICPNCATRADKKLKQLTFKLVTKRMKLWLQRNAEKGNRK